MNNNLTYAKSGVNIKKSNEFIKLISLLSKKTSKSGDFKNIGGFGAINRIPNNLKNPYLVTSTDGVGTKIEIANELGKFDTIGIDLVAMCVNDIIVQGAKPMLFLDYISVDKINNNKLKNIIKGIMKGCKIAGCKLVGGETAEMPGTYSKNKFDLAGFSVGIVEKKKILKNKIRKNDLIVAIPSNGLHSNGYSLVRYVLRKKKINIRRSKYLKKELIKPTQIYVKYILKLIEKNLLNSCANITGGGLIDNIVRVIPKKYCAKINLNKIKTLKIFKWLSSNGISDKEMLNTFNCGVGFCLIINKKHFKKLKNFFPPYLRPYIIGQIVENKSKALIEGKINW